MIFGWQKNSRKHCCSCGVKASKGDLNGNGKSRRSQRRLKPTEKKVEGSNGSSKDDGIPSSDSWGVDSCRCHDHSISPKGARQWRILQLSCDWPRRTPSISPYHHRPDRCTDVQNRFPSAHSRSPNRPISFICPLPSRRQSFWHSDSFLVALAASFASCRSFKALLIY